MLEWWNPLSWSAAGWSAVAAWFALVVALTAARLVWSQVAEARRLRLEQAQPYVIVDFEPARSGYSAMQLVIENTGTTPAFNVRFAFEPPLASSLDVKRPLRDSPLLRNGVPALPPRRRLETLFEIMACRFHEGDELPYTYTAKVSFGDSAGRQYELSYVLDLWFYKEMTVSSGDTVHDVSKNLEKLTREVAGLRGTLLQVAQTNLQASMKRGDDE